MRHRVVLVKYAEKKTQEVYNEYGDVLLRSQRKWDNAMQQMENVHKRLFECGGK